ncbi:MAG TPA: hypothetical protein VMA55_18785 [Acidovorax sp.]|nr:hypothetical protein [Acidovorax sp.]
MIDYQQFQDGLKNGLRALWQPWFMSGVRNGGFEQTLRNLCMPHIEKATGRMAFTESRGRADLLLCDDDAELCTRCEFKVNFAQQHGRISGRKEEAIGQVKGPTGHRAQDGVVVYAIAELIHSQDGLTGKATRHNGHVASTSYKLFQSQDVSAAHMKHARAKQESVSAGRHGPIPAFMPLFDQNGLCLEWESNVARLHVWTHHQTTGMT